MTNYSTDLPLTLPIDSPIATLQNSGGKGANLSRLARAGFPVPPGFLVTTAAYEDFLGENDLEEIIKTSLVGRQTGDPAVLQENSATIRQAFLRGRIPPNLIRILGEAYATLGGGSVAVRSSATAEDLPDLSFAGQQDTYLNVIGEIALLEAVVICWSSLWTARAIGYRARNGIPHLDVRLAVVVQKMVLSEASGVLFTANPLTGMRKETVIDATLGLGEALVGGYTEPDHYVVNSIQGRIQDKKLGSKSVVIQGIPSGGVERLSQDASNQQAIPDDQIIKLATLGSQVEKEFGFPQDIEWSYAQGNLYLLQSRPITSLFPLPEGMGIEPLRAMFSFGAIQGILDPMTPFGQDLMRLVFAHAGKFFGLHRTHETQQVIWSAGERLWVNITTLIRNAVGLRIIRQVLPAVEPSVAQALETLYTEPNLAAGQGHPRPGTILRIARFFLPIWGKVLRNWIDPDRRRDHLHTLADQEITKYKAKRIALQVENVNQGDIHLNLANRLNLLDEIPRIVLEVIPSFLAGVISGIAPLFMLNRISAHLSAGDPHPDPDPLTLVFQITRGMPNNVTTEMDLQLWETACTIREKMDGYTHFQHASPEELAGDYLAGNLPPSTQNAIQHFLERYGARGLGEVDIGRPRWQEDPTPVMQALQSYLRIEDASLAPDAVFERGAKDAEVAIAILGKMAQASPGGWLKVRFVRWAVRRVRALAGLRESPKFFVVRMIGVLRQVILDCGVDFVAAGVLEQPDDLFFLDINQLYALARGEARDWKSLIDHRRQIYAREKRRTQIPRLLLSDGRAFYEGLGALPQSGDSTLTGNPVSPGVVEGVVRVIFDPHRTQLAPGEILVCPGTDPSWTPLFLAAGGLVMEVGGMMTHGSVVAREYGIPAVVGVHQATTRLKSGQRVRVDGTTGRVVVLDGEGENQ